MKKDKKKKSEHVTQIDGEAENDVSGNETELRQPIWSVVSFEKCAAKNLTYAEAERKIAELASQKVSGLCLVTDAVAERIAERK